MRLEIVRRQDFARDETVIEFRGEVLSGDLVKLQLGTLDRALMRELDVASDLTSADYLLVLEMLFRRYGEQTGK